MLKQDEVLGKDGRRYIQRQKNFFFLYGGRQILKLNCKSFLGRISTIYLKLSLPVSQLSMAYSLTEMLINHLINVSELHSDLKEHLFLI